MKKLIENTQAALTQLQSGAFTQTFSYLYGEQAISRQASRYSEAVEQFALLFGEDRPVRFFSAPGRTEVGGNHTDHQHGRVLAAGVNLDVIAVVSPLCGQRTNPVQGFPHGYRSPSGFGK